jgi:hypothetical protein
MYDTIKTYIGTFFTTLNTSLSEDFSEADTLLDKDNLPASRMDKVYLVKLADCEDLNYDSPIYDITVKIEVWFLIANMVGNYATAIDTYLRPLLKQLKSSSMYEGTTFCVNGIESIKLTGLDNILDGGNYLQPTITATFKCTDIS